MAQADQSSPTRRAGGCCRQRGWRIPSPLAIVWLLRADMLKARIEAAADVDNNHIRVAHQEILGKAVEFATFQDHGNPAEIIGQGQRL